MTPDEENHLKEQAALAGMTMSAYVRKRCLGHAVVAKADLVIINELRRLGGLFKHTCAEGSITPEQRDEALKAVVDAIKRVARHDRQED